MGVTTLRPIVTPVSSVKKELKKYEFYNIINLWFYGIY